jgi:ribosomal-protein-alanine N-acetyltransferase
VPSFIDLIIESDRLRLVAASELFAEDIYNEFTAEVTRYMRPKPLADIEEALGFLREARAKAELGTRFDAVITLKETGEFLGIGGMHDADTDTPELDIWIKKGAHGNRYGLEAICAVVTWAFENLDVRYLKYLVDRRNGASRRIPEAFGGVVEAEHPWTSVSGFELALLEYRIYPPR